MGWWCVFLVGGRGREGLAPNPSTTPKEMSAGVLGVVHG